MGTLEVLERQLASEGLAPIEDADRPRPGLACAGAKLDRRRKILDSTERVTAVEAYLAWAHSVLETYPWERDAAGRVRRRTSRVRQVWELYADGKTISEIAAATGGSRRSVTRALERVMLASVPAPGPNPWRKDGRGRHLPTGEQLDALARQADPEAVAEMYERALEGPTMQPKKSYLYERILLRPGGEHDVKGKPQKERLVNVEGTPHAGGIDVELTWEANGVKTPVVSTVPWWKIKQADRAVEG